MAFQKLRAFLEHRISPRRLWLFLCCVELLGFFCALCISLLSAYCFELVRKSPINDIRMSYRFLAAWISGVLACLILCWQLVYWNWISQTSRRFWRLGIPGFMVLGSWSGLNIVIVPFGLQSVRSVHGPQSLLRLLEVSIKESLSQ
jgi:hypothetical protein